ncbi:GyrI-like domain-containing protein [Alloscardovia omnicolens]|uniref:GyrI-like domain-containing protein n=1 Tax=Alloscardovia omnicolens TaxID=419015 RepID=UPI00066952B9|nr:GyrI-like domain-containing protein [Alloscardovia omnicolens]MDK6327675.1 GyrI-like domain-containing protein [Alloscardovia omnicolens]MDK8073922.1 GyrI-like domain-containing protein [Alloscardovia omnicolens]MDK8081728.1 GyrI-like domain-containing protein [Alloscardovia omnicolens]MDK8649085.1 GyrI-like domain-containing protein [Alloscardovia omnicolens]
MAFDFKKKYKELYSPAQQPHIIDVEPIKFLAVRGHGNPNDESGEYQQSIGLLYPLMYTIKMGKKGQFDFVVPPLDGLWWQEGVRGYNPQRKDQLSFISMIRVPDFVTEDVLQWAKIQVEHKKKLDTSKAELFTYTEELCVQALHIGSYDSEPETVEKMHQYAQAQGCALDITDPRHHHEIYIGDPRRAHSDKLKTVICQPIK